METVAIEIFCLSVGFLVIYSVGYLFIYPVSHDPFKGEFLPIKFIVIGSIGFFTLVLILIIHPVMVVFCLDFIAIILHIASPKSWNRYVIWEKITLLSVIVIAAGYLLLLITPNFMHFQSKARQSEAKTNLYSIALAEIAYFSEKGNFSDSFTTIGWNPEGKTKYSYFLSDDFEADKCFLVEEQKLRGWAAWSFENNWIFGNPSYIMHKTISVNMVNLKPALEFTATEFGIGANPSGFTAIAIGNIDNDAELDIWIINDMKELRNINNDVNLGPGRDITTSLYFLEFFNGGFYILLDRLTGLLFVLNLLGWFALFLRRKTTRPSSAQSEKLN